ncbi:nitroreductase [Denitrovibrio acetiphilus DSM 12809]|uniref:Nitroreductase n=1 Tax=Denitrovibrio acetiphilus (strain DSM 12809 / NBRC 114555 / N2460) TaxID=522772 RepID=D4H3Z1_DENA2|nr:nitroreductase family protein [Denitrovibrio acetiphilus]ADD67302.1 nitroreductase [Denitrovibrio acetiphilus DSM 12809]
MDILQLITKNRSYRRFDNSRKLEDTFLSELVDAARLSQSGANAQPLRYITVNTPDMCEKLYAHLLWAGRLKEWDGPVEEERPTAYVVVLADKQAPKIAMPLVDSGLAMQNMCLYAISKGVGSCMIGNFIKPEIKKLLEIDERYELMWVVALGYPVENVVLETVKDDVAYHRDAEGNHYVPKYKAEDILLNKF